VRRDASDSFCEEYRHVLRDVVNESRVKETERGDQSDRSHSLEEDNSSFLMI
jgi:hypothetical protein